MIVPNAETTESHANFLNWLNSEILSPTTGFWNELVNHLQEQLLVKKISVYLQEFYAPDEVTLVGFAVFINLDITSRDVYYFSRQGQPLYYNKGGAGEILTLDEESANVEEVHTGTSIILKNAQGVDSFTLSLNLENMFGYYASMLRVTDMNATDGVDPVAIGIIDATFELPATPSYNVHIEPDTLEQRYAVKNITKQRLDITVVLFPHKTEQYRIAPDETVYVHKTPSSEYTLRQMKELGLIKYK